MPSVSTILALLVCSAAGAYLLGCSNGAILISSLFYREDVRSRGSGNAGLTNYYRSYGAKYALFVIAVDMLKAALAVWLGRELFGALLGQPLLGKYYAALWCVVGHMFPAFYAFHGGKGILCSGTLLLLLDWRIALVGWSLFILLWLSTRYVSLGSTVAAVSFPITTFAVYRSLWETVLAVVIALLVLWAHRENLRRLRQGTESRFRFHLNGDDAGQRK